MEMWTDDQMRSIHKMLNPRSIAVVGASPKGGYGGRLLNAVLKAKDRVRIYPVNPNYDEIAETKCYRSIAELPEAPDLVGIVVPYDQVLPVLKECHAKQAGSAIVISAGFAERGSAARLDLQKEVGAYAKQSGAKVLYPVNTPTSKHFLAPINLIKNAMNCPCSGAICICAHCMD